MCARKRLIQQFALALLFCSVMFGMCSDAQAQSVWQKMKQQVLQQQCQQGLQKACQALAKISQQQGQQPQQGQPAGQQPGQPTPSMPSSGHHEGNRGGDESGPVHPPHGTKVEEAVMAPLAQGAKFFISPHGVHIATLENSGSRAVMYYDGVPGLKFDEVLGGQINSSSEVGVAFSPDGKRYA